MYHLPPHLAGYGAADQSLETFEPLGLRLPPLSGYGALTLPAMSGYVGMGNPAPPVVQAPPAAIPPGGPVENTGQPVKVELGTGTKIFLFGLGGLVLAGFGWLMYKEVQLRSEIVKAGGGRALAEYELAKAAGTAAGSLGTILGGGSEAKPNRRRKSKRNRRRR